MDFGRLEMNDDEGRRLVSARVNDPFRRKPVWAAYKIRRGLQGAVSRNSPFVDLATARATADSLNSHREMEEEHYFKVYRADVPSEPEI